MAFRFFILLLLPFFLYARDIKVATYNVENLFDMKNNGTEYREYIPNRHNWTEQILRKKLTNIAEVICDVNPDVIGLEEIENSNILKRLQNILDRVGCTYRYTAITNTRKTPIRNALLSKIPIKKQRDVQIGHFGRYRSILEVQLKSKPPIRILVNHWRSKKAPESKRIPYAKSLMKRLHALPKGMEYILLGDFNTNYNEFKTIDSKHNDTHGVVGLNQILRSTYQGKLVRLDSLSDASNLHYNLWLELAQGSRWSHNFYGKKESLDSILIPESMHDGAGWNYVDDSFGVFKPNYLFGKRGEIKRWAYKSGKHLGNGYSDHLPIYATFRLTKTKQDSGIWNRFTSIFGNTGQKTVKKSKVEPETVYKPATIADIISLDRIDKAIKLKNVKVIFKRYKSAIIKQTSTGRSILLYRCADLLEEGNSYDLVIYKKKMYKGLDEITDIEVDKELDKQDVMVFIKKFAPNMMTDSKYINEVLTGIVAIYEGNMIKTNGKIFPIYFKRGAGRPAIGSKIRITRVQIGYYKDHMQLVVWDKNDYQVIK